MEFLRITKILLRFYFAIMTSQDFILCKIYEAGANFASRCGFTLESLGIIVNSNELLRFYLDFTLQLGLPMTFP